MSYNIHKLNNNAGNKQHLSLLQILKLQKKKEKKRKHLHKPPCYQPNCSGINSWITKDQNTNNAGAGYAVEHQH
jgi:hypothetical protein